MPAAPSAFYGDYNTPLHVYLNWINEDTYDSINLYYKYGGAGWSVRSISGSLESYDDMFVVQGQECQYYLRAVIGGVESDPTNTVDGYGGVQTPGNLRFTNIGTGTVTVEWDNYGIPDYDALILGVKEFGSNWLDIALTGTDELRIRNCTVNVYLSFRIKGRIGTIWSAQSNEIGAWTAPHTPTGLTATTAGPNKISLGWTNVGPNQGSILIMRKVLGGSYSALAFISGNLNAYDDESVIEGTAYYYEIAAGQYGAYSAYSNEANNSTILNAPTGLQGTCLSKTSVKLDWTDTNGTEDGSKIYKDGSYHDSVGANVTTLTITGLTPGCWYHFYVTAYNSLGESPASNEIRIWTWDPPSAPTLLTARSISTSRIDLAWQDNADNETSFRIERSDDGGANYTEIDTVGANITHYSATGLTSNFLYYFRVRAHNDSGDSDFSNVTNAQTFAAIATPTNLQAWQYSTTAIEIIFQDNSSLEDFHCVEMRDGSGTWNEIVQLAPNVEYYRKTGLTVGHTYTFQVRALQGVSSYSAYSNVAGATLEVPDPPASLAISEYGDIWARLTWVNPIVFLAGHRAGAGYKIEKSTDGGANYTEIARVGPEIEYFKVTGLTAGATYYFRVCAYIDGADSAYATPVSCTTLTAYTDTAFEVFSRNPIIRPTILGKVNPIMKVSGFAFTSGHTYEITIQGRGIDVDELFENGVALVKTASAAEVDSAVGSFFFDYFARKLYLHTTTGGDPVNVTITIAFWLKFTNRKTATHMIDFDDDNYLPFLSLAGIPDISQEIQPYYEGSFIISSGSITLINAWMNGYYFFDTIYREYEWRNRKMVLMIGDESWPLASFKTFFTGVINSVDCGDAEFTLSLRDQRENLNLTIPETKITDIEYPFLDSSANNKPKPFSYGVVVGFPGLLIDTVGRKYLFHDGRVYSVDAVTQNGTALSEGTDYFVDYRRGILTIARGGAWDVMDSILISFHGAVNDANEKIENGAEIFKHLLNTRFGMADADLNLDSIYYTKYARPTNLTMILYKAQSSDVYIKGIEHSLMAWTYQDEQGRIGLRVKETTPAGGARAIHNHQIWDFKQSKSVDSIFKTVEVYYSEDPQTQKYSVVSKTNNLMDWVSGAKNTLPPFYTYVNNESDALVLCDDLLDELDKDFITFEAPFILFECLPAELIYFSRDRFFSLDGAANNIVLRLLKIGRSPSNGRNSIKAEVVA
jgi:hypothetical protein